MAHRPGRWETVSEAMKVLYRVQQGDTEIAGRETALAGLDDGAELADELAAAEADLARLQEQHRATDKDNLDCELELKALEEKKARFDRQLNAGTVRNLRQIQDLEGEVKMLSREIGKLEERMLELMEKLDAQNADIAGKEAELQAKREQLAEARSKFQGTGSRLRSEIAELRAEREQYAAQVEPTLLKRYEQIRARQANLGLVKVTRDTCPGCRIALPSETLKALRAGRSNLACDNCGRLLFWDESEG